MSELVKLNLSEMLSVNGSGSYSLNITKAQNGVILNVNCSYHNPDANPGVSYNKNESYVFEGTDSEVQTKLNALGLDNTVSVNL